jgi:hypothetical protein
MSEEEKSAGKKEEEAKPSAASLIPEVYYDIIARVPAGSLLVLFALRTLIRGGAFSLPESSAWFTANGVSVLVVVCFIMGLGGLVGILISPLANVCRNFYWKRAWLAATAKGPYQEITPKLKQLGFAGLPDCSAWATLSSADFHGLDRWMYDFVQENSVIAKTLLPKLRAEADLCSYLGAAFLILPVLHGTLWAALLLTSETTKRAALASFSPYALVWYVASWLVTVLLCFSGSYRTKRLVLRMLSMLWVIATRLESK